MNFAAHQQRNIDHGDSQLQMCEIQLYEGELEEIKPH